MAAFQFIRKRDGTVQPFQESKVTEAIWKAMRASGEKNGRKTAEQLTQKVIEQLNQKFNAQNAPTVEETQDVVEKVLVESGLAPVAKRYIIYRQQRADLRREKAQILEKQEIDAIDKRFDVNALRVLKARYLRKDANGKLLETPRELFTRIAVHAMLPNLLYDSRMFDLSENQAEWQDEEFLPAAHDNQYSVGKFSLNQYHLEALKRMYDRFNQNHQMRKKWGDFLQSLTEGSLDGHEKQAQEFFDIMVERKFFPNTPAIANFGAVLGMGSACFVLDVADSIDGVNGIMESLKSAAIIFKSGGGVGYNFSRLRPEGDFVSTTSGAASGPISFMSLFDKMTEVIKQGGIRRGANMGILNSNHPNIEQFITAKEGNKALTNFNISVLIMPDFWEYYEKNEPYPLVNPRTGEIARTVNPRMLFDLIVHQAWESAEPGVIFFDRVNEYNPFADYLGPIVTTNPCGEVLLYPNESCNLGSINVWNFFRENEAGESDYDWQGLQKTIIIATRFLDNVIDVNKFPLKEIEEMTLNTRKIGVGVMGVADLLYEMGLPYNAEEGRAFMEKLMEFVSYHTKAESVQLAKERGPLPFFEKSFFKEGKLPFAGFYDQKSWHFDWNELSEKVKTIGIRNGYTTVIAPTGSISMIAGTSSGIEPVYTMVFEKNVKVGSFYYVDPVFEETMKHEGLYDAKLMEEVSENRGSVQDIHYIPERLKRVFVTAMDISPEDHIRALAAFQKWTDSSISKTNNFPADATVDHMRESYLLAYKLGCKDVTVFRDSSIKNQVLVAPKSKKESNATAPAPGSLEPKIVHQANSQGEVVSMQTHSNSKYSITRCPKCDNATQIKEGCVSCPHCGWGICS